MSDDPDFPPTPPMTPERARDIARAWQGLAENLRGFVGTPGEIREAEQRSLWWVAYAATLERKTGDDT
jgi:hypothetical protein